MDLLLDSHALLWALASPDKLTVAAAREIENPSRIVYFSPASIWELELKRSRGKLTLPDGWIEAIGRTGFLELPITALHAVTAGNLPWHHQDPFDRMLVAQAQVQGLRFVTRDRLAAVYGVVLLEA